MRLAQGYVLGRIPALHLLDAAAAGMMMAEKTRGRAEHEQR